VTWLDPTELRVGLGCMRLPLDDTGSATIAAAVESGITVFDTARAYDGNERFLAASLRGAPVRIVTKGGMSRAGGAWIPDGRAKAILADCEASLEALDGLPVDTYLVHTPDPRTPWRTTVRALGRLVERGLVARVGVCNVNRAELDEAIELAPISAVQVPLSRFDDKAVRGGVLERCEDAGIALIAHSPLGGPKRSARVAEPEAALAELLALSPIVVAIPGATRPETARSAAAAASIRLEAPPRSRVRARVRSNTDVVLVIGIPGAGKSRVAAEYVGRGYTRLNRDERGGSLRDVAGDLEEELARGCPRVVLDNTYLTRASRNHVVEVAQRHGARVRCVLVDTPLAQAQVNLVERLLDRFGDLPMPEQLKEVVRGEPGLLAPTSQMRAARELEPPSTDEGFAEIEVVPFVRAPRDGRPGILVAAAAAASIEPCAEPVLVFDWRPDGGTVDAPAGVTEVAVCPHGGGPPVCWCRPPLPGLLLAFARRHGVDPARSVLVGTSSAHRTMAKTLGCAFDAR
jgi:aryl-alcohol dehydrogenase-like predicted oxidoreductase